MRRILIAALLGGLANFLWGAVSHMVLPTGDMGLKALPQEDAVVAAMRQTIHEKGVYFIPGMDMHKKMTAEQQSAWEGKIKSGPVALLVYQPAGGQTLSLRPLLIELLSNIAAALVAAIALARMTGGYAGRAFTVMLLGLFAWLSISVSYWNWYQFSDAFTRAEAVDQILGWLVAGLVIAAIVRPPAVVV
jgi:hypothetical protein